MHVSLCCASRQWWSGGIAAGMPLTGMRVWLELDYAPLFSLFIYNLCYIVMQVAAVFYARVGSTFSEAFDTWSLDKSRVIWPCPQRAWKGWRKAGIEWKTYPKLLSILESIIKSLSLITEGKGENRPLMMGFLNRQASRWCVTSKLLSGFL